MEKCTGRKLTIIMNLIGVLVAYLSMNILFSHEPDVPLRILCGINEFKLELIVGISFGLLASYYIGGIAGDLILKKNYSPNLIGIVISFLILFLEITAGFIFSFLLKFQIAELQNKIGEWIFTLVWTFLLGAIQTIILGTILGLWMQSKKDVLS